MAGAVVALAVSTAPCLLIKSLRLHGVVGLSRFVSIRPFATSMAALIGGAIYLPFPHRRIFI